MENRRVTREKSYQNELKFYNFNFQKNITNMMSNENNLDVALLHIKNIFYAQNKFYFVNDVKTKLLVLFCELF